MNNMKNKCLNRELENRKISVNLLIANFVKQMFHSKHANQTLLVANEF